MFNLLRNEVYKLKRQWFLLFVVLLAIFPIFIGGARVIMGGSEFILSELFFFINNQVSMFFPMTIFILIGSLFYIEYKNNTYINYITYGYSKTKLFFSKVIVANIIGAILAILTAIIFVSTIFIAKSLGVTIIFDVSWLSLAIGYFLETIIIIIVTSFLGALIINQSRNMIISSIIGVFYGFISVLFVGLDTGIYMAGSFAYRISMYFVNTSSYYDNVMKATITGSLSVGITILIYTIIGLLIFCRKKAIEV